MVLVIVSNRLAKKVGTVAIPPLRYLGNNQIAVTIMAKAANVSHTITNIPSPYAAPLSPTICSVERLVKSKEPAMVTAPRLRPPKK